ncbi:MAG: hypothetical protein Q4D98_07355 [Planctomycetia bacterium]|nr:hypothetical protein [Planctomycetia bacterium]
MNIKLDQIFYGHDGIRYRILEGTCPSLNTKVQSLCEALGTPDPTQEIPKFLMSVPHGDKLIMICGQQGKRDNSNRTTLFFHAFICQRELAEEAGIDAFFLNRKNYFLGSISGSPQPLNISKETGVPSQIEEPHEPTSYHLKQVIIVASTAQNDILRDLLRGEVNRRCWATFSWNPLPDFDFYVLWSREKRAFASVARKLPEEPTIIEKSPKVLPMKPLPAEEKKEEIQPTSDDTPKSKTNFLIFLLWYLLLCTVIVLVVLILRGPIRKFFTNPDHSVPTITEETSLTLPKDGTESEPPQTPPLAKDPTFSSLEELQRWIISKQDNGSWPNGIPMEVEKAVKNYIGKVVRSTNVTYSERVKCINNILTVMRECLDEEGLSHIEDYGRTQRTLLEEEKQVAMKQYSHELNDTLKSLVAKYRKMSDNPYFDEMEKSQMGGRLKIAIENNIRSCEDISQLIQKFKECHQVKSDIPKDWGIREFFDDHMYRILHKDSSDIGRLQNDVGKILDDKFTLEGMRVVDIANELTRWEIEVRIVSFAKNGNKENALVLQPSKCYPLKEPQSNIPIMQLGNFSQKSLGTFSFQVRGSRAVCSFSPDSRSSLLEKRDSFPLWEEEKPHTATFQICDDKIQIEYTVKTIQGRSLSEILGEKRYE